MKTQMVSVEEWGARHEERERDRGIKPGKYDRLGEFISGFLVVDRAKKLVQRIGDYNGFDPDQVCEWLKKYAARIDRVSVGYEGSPVIYVWMTENAPEGYVHEGATELMVMADWVGYDLHAGGDRQIIRAWWD